MTRKKPPWAADDPRENPADLLVCSRPHCSFKLPGDLVLANVDGLVTDTAEVKGGEPDYAQEFSNQIDPSLTWEFVAWLRSVCSLPLFIKARPPGSACMLCLSMCRRGWPWHPNPAATTLKRREGRGVLSCGTLAWGSRAEGMAACHAGRAERRGCGARAGCRRGRRCGIQPRRAPAGRCAASAQPEQALRI